MEQRDGNLAFKCTFNDGGASPAYLGFQGTCSDGNIIRNIRHKRVTWCSHPDNDCRRFYDADLTGARPHLPCYESEVFPHWQFGGGVFHGDVKAGETIPIKAWKRGRVALLTTRVPWRDSEAERIVFAVTQIRNVSRRGESMILEGDPKRSIRLTTPVANSMRYWDFKGGVRRWGTGLFRYWSDDETRACLSRLHDLLQDPDERAVAGKLLECVGGYQAGTVSLGDTDGQSVLKYGPGGEGARHKALKAYVAANPHELGLTGVDWTKQEYRFITGDRVDVAGGLSDGRHVVVEVELEGGLNTEIGAHQCLKYRALMKGKHVTSGVAALLVAHDIPAAVRAFCREHDIVTVEIPEVKVAKWMKRRR